MSQKKQLVYLDFDAISAPTGPITGRVAEFTAELKAFLTDLGMEFVTGEPEHTEAVAKRGTTPEFTETVDAGNAYSPECTFPLPEPVACDITRKLNTLFVERGVEFVTARALEGIDATIHIRRSNMSAEFDCIRGAAETVDAGSGYSYEMLKK